MSIIKVKKYGRTNYYTDLTKFCKKKNFKRQTVYNKLGKDQKCKFKGFDIERIKAEKKYTLEDGTVLELKSVL